ncbi:two-component regulator propeller domain-containing protein [Pseudoalteromonas sp. bablab_jr011]|uniref:ligand-binding sensor domain-containing protein n=1 Tax=Pseudoalteromonas sp. bablab_jr011 TaxID=2755062 RepID=UPI0018F4D3DA|nr:ligand-binding sensor domain-containing diguanylate cyclase [Pseudoalteromonas sp. bablab_jr011]
MARVVSLILLCVCFSAFAESTRLSLSDYFTETWNTRSGLPHNSINSVAQTKDGYIWIATWEGLARFNGREFKLFTRTEIPGLPDSGLRSLIAIDNGDLYIVGARGGIAVRSQGQWRSLPSSSTMINHALISEQGEIWLALEGQGIVYRASEKATEHTLVDKLSAYRLIKDKQNVIWAATSDGLYKIEGKKVSKVGQEAGLPDASAFTLLLTQSGTLIVGTEKGAWQKQHDKFVSVDATLNHESISSLLEDTQGDIWFGTINKGVFRLRQSGLENLDADDGLPNNRTLSLLQDREKSIWVGTNAGLFRLREAPFTNWSQSRGLASDYVRTVLSHSDGSLWVGSSNGLNRIINGEITTLNQAYERDPLSVLSLTEDKNGDVWLGTYTGGLMKVVNNKIYPVKNRTYGLLNNEVRAVLFDSSHNLWIGTASGLTKLTDDGQIHSYTTEKGLAGNFIMALAEDNQGRLWVGTGVGVSIFDPALNTFSNIEFPEKFSTEYAFGFYLDGEKMWLATDRGLIRYDLKTDVMHLFGREQGLPVDKLFQVIEQGDSLWLTSNRGVIQLNKTQLTEFLDNPTGAESVVVSMQLYDEGDGMLSAQANGGSNPAAVTHSDGQLWVATAKGVAIVKPERLKEASKRRLSTVIESFEVDGKPVGLPAKSDVLSLPAGISRVSFNYAGLSFIMPQRLNYQTHLSGYNEEWVDRGRLAITEYTNLPPGEYTFKVRAGYPNSEWQNNEQTLRFRIAPYFWQKTSFKLVLILGLFLIAYAIYKYRLYHYKRIEIELTEKVEQQMHDLKNQADAFAHLANHDQLTQLPNRRAFDSWLFENFSQFQHNKQSLSVAIMDIDHFKLINDNFSHLIGDQVICEIARLLRINFPDEGYAARWGGEEFTLLFPHKGADEAARLCEIIRLEIADYNFSELAKELSVTVSFGVADNANVTDYDRLLSHADTALYHAKNNGRNKVVIYNKETSIL